MLPKPNRLPDVTCNMHDFGPKLNRLHRFPALRADLANTGKGR